MNKRIQLMDYIFKCLHFVRKICAIFLKNMKQLLIHLDPNILVFSFFRPYPWRFFVKSRIYFKPMT